MNGFDLSDSATRLRRYAVAAFIAAAAISIRSVLDTLLGDQAVFSTILVAIAFITWYCGRGPALLSLLAGLLAGIYFFATPRYSVAIHGSSERAVLVIYAISAVMIVTLIEMIRSAHRRIRTTADQLQAEVAHRKRAQQDAIAASNAKSEFLASMSHEIRTPMTAILGFTELLLQNDSPEEERRNYLEIVHENGQTLLELINEILDLSKVEAGQLRVERVACSPSQIVEEVVALKKLEATQRNLELSAHYHYPLPQTIHTDPMRLRQILMNLVGNAIKFTEHGSVRITVRMGEKGLGIGDWGVERKASNASSITPPSPSPIPLHFAVSDTGIGIGRDGLSKLFRPFSQIDSTLSRSRGGAGLGLAISKQLAIMLGGDIAVESTPGQGSTFTLQVDPGSVENVPMLSAAQPASATERPDVPRTFLHGRVLLAEDTRANQHLIRRILEKAGATVDIVENGRLAIEKAEASLTQQRPYDVVLMDVQMPEMDGLEATRRLRRNGWRRPIVALTAHAMEGDRQTCLQAGCNDYLSKPIRRERLLGLVGSYMDSNETGA